MAEHIERYQQQTTEGGAEMAYNWEIEIQGGYGWLLESDQTSSLLATGHPHPGDGAEHQMMLIVDPQKIEVEGDADPARFWWLLTGVNTLASSAGRGVTRPKNSQSKKELPNDPDRLEDWDDEEWLPPRLKAVQNPRERASASLSLPGGTLSVLPPTNLGAKRAVWVFPDHARGEKALTDRLQLNVPAEPSLQLRGHNLALTLKPAEGADPQHPLRLWIRHELELTDRPLSVGFKLHHWVALTTAFAANPARQVPALTRFKGSAIAPNGAPLGMFSPGNLCPPVLLDA